MIYLDHNATTPPEPAVLDAMMPYFTEKWGNPSSAYRFGDAARNAVEVSRETIAHALGASAPGIVFTSGATESINSALHSAIIRFPEKKHIVTSAVEHSATLAYCEHLKRDFGFEITRLGVDQNGLLDTEGLRKSIREDTALVSLIWANNETGVIWPIDVFASICREKGALFHIDGAQAVGKIPVSFEVCGADFLSFSGHKIGCPKGIGGLLIREPNTFKPLIYGGKQEHGLRGGTENVAFVVGLSKAVELCTIPRAMQAWDEIKEIRNYLEAQVQASIPGAMVNGKTAPRLPNTLSLHLPGIDSDATVTYLDQKNICVSSGSACLESAIAPSHVIYAMRQSHEIAGETIRISLNRNTQRKELEKLIKELVHLCAIYS